jgi:hypothetical protein
MKKLLSLQILSVFISFGSKAQMILGHLNNNVAVVTINFEQFEDAIIDECNVSGLSNVTLISTAK